MRASVCARACVCDVTRLYSDRPPFLVTVLNVKSYIYIHIFFFFFFFFFWINGITSIQLEFGFSFVAHRPDNENCYYYYYYYFVSAAVALTKATSIDKA